MYVQNFNFVALPIPEIIKGTQKNLGISWIRLRSLFSKFLMGVDSVGVDSVNVPAKFEVRIASSVPDITAIRVLGGGCEPQSSGRGSRREAVRGRGWYRSKER